MSNLTPDQLEILSDPGALSLAASDLMKGVSADDYESQIEKHNFELTVLAASTHLVGVTQPVLSFMAILKASLATAYLLGRRDAIEIPDVFKDALK